MLFFKSSLFSLSVAKTQRKTPLVGAIKYFSFPVILSPSVFPVGAHRLAIPETGVGHQLFIAVPDFWPPKERR